MPREFYEQVSYCLNCEAECTLSEKCRTCQLCSDCCECDTVGVSLFDADELGLDPEEDDERYRR